MQILNTASRIKHLVQLKARISVRLYWLVLLLLSSCTNSQLPAQDIAVDDVGYKPDAPKIGYVQNSVEGDSFAVVDNKSSEVVFKNAVEVNLKKDPATGETVKVLNFTEFREPGIYKLRIPGTGAHSVKFRIADHVYNQVLKKTLESYYYQRCGIKIGIADKWGHSACHLDDAVFYENPEKQKDVTGGWHDAGDYGKYSVNTAVSLSFLLYLYDHKKEAFTDGQLDIPEKDNGIPDLLDEAKWALTWLMKMQRSDGAVYHKIQKKKWTGEYLPQHDPDTRYIYEVSSTATADLAAVAALGARLYKSDNAEFADSLKAAATKAWNYLEEHPNMVPRNGFKNPEGVKGGEYSDHKDSDERLWAAVELFRLTKKAKYEEFFIKNYTSLGGPKSPPVSWKNVSELAYYSYVRIPRRHQNARAREYLIQKLTNYADNLVKRVSRNGYRIVLNEDEYYWGSNSVVLGYAFDLVQAYELTGMELYKEAALDQLHYILGRNPFKLSFVTGVGDNSVENPYHQFSMKLDTALPVPGMVVGGPNSQNQLHDEALSRNPAKNYEDSEKNYMVNEVAINYTGPLVYLAGYFSDPDSKPVSTNSKK